MPSGPPTDASPLPPVRIEVPDGSPLVEALRRFLGGLEYFPGEIVVLSAKRFVREVLGGTFEEDGANGLRAVFLMREAYRATPFDPSRDSFDRHVLDDSRGRRWTLEATWRGRWLVEAFPYF